MIWLFLATALAAVPPRTVTRQPGDWEVPAVLDVVTGPTWATVASRSDLAPDLLAVLGRSGHSVRPRARAQVLLDGDPTVPADGYRVEVSPEGVRVTASTRLGMRAGLDTLAELARAPTIPAGEYADAPVLRQRWAHVQLPGRSTAGDPLLARQKAVVPALSSVSGTADMLPWLSAFAEDALDARLNGVVIELNGNFRFDSHPELALPYAAPLASLRPIVDRLRQAGAAVVPLLPLFAHQEDLLAPAYPDLLLAPMRVFPQKRGRAPDALFYWSPLYDPRKAAVQAIVTDLVHEALALFGAEVLHAGHDEAGALRFVQHSPKEGVDLFVESVEMVRKSAAARGARTAIWADMLLDGHRFPGVAHGNEAGIETWRALDRIDPSVLLVDWQYASVPKPWPEKGEVEDVPSLRYLAASGHPVMGAALGRPVSPESPFGPWTRQSTRMARTLASLSETHDVWGQLTCHFAFGPGRLQPWPGTDVAASLLLAGNVGWTGGSQGLPATE